MQPWKLEPAKDHGLSLRESFRSLRRENGLVATGLHMAWWSVVRTYLGFYHRLGIHGKEHIPRKPPFVMVANHASHLDTLALAAAVPWSIRASIYPIAAGDVFFETPTRSALSALLLNALPMWRRKVGSHALQELRTRLLEEQCAYILFPEGTRSRDGTMTDFKQGIGMLVANSSVPVVPCFLEGCHNAWKPHQKFPRPRKICVRIGPSLSFADVPNERAGWQEVASRLEAAVRALDPTYPAATALEPESKSACP